jgi:predicted Zn-dependent protease
VLAAFLGACASSGVNAGQPNLISLEEEWSLGERLAGDLRGKLRLVDDPQAVGYVSQVGGRIVAQTELANLPWHFHIVDDPEVNAFAIPGGQVYVDTGLIGAADDVAEFAGVLAHEVAHGVARHGSEQLTRAYGLQIVAGLVLDQNAPVYQQVLAQLVGQGAMAKFSRDDEREADALGVVYMSEAGYDPHGMPRVFKVLLNQRRSQPSSVAQFFSSHPLTEQRIRDVQAEIAAKHLTGSIDHDPGYQRLRKRF